MAKTPCPLPMAHTDQSSPRGHLQQAHPPAARASQPKPRKETNLHASQSSVSLCSMCAWQLHSALLKSVVPRQRRGSRCVSCRPITLQATASPMAAAAGAAGRSAKAVRALEQGLCRHGSRHAHPTHQNKPRGTWAVDNPSRHPQALIWEAMGNGVHPSRHPPAQIWEAMGHPMLRKAMDHSTPIPPSLRLPTVRAAQSR